ncbi:hypothetical protein [Klebsiella quasipneumoniae]|uniref:hypothetical protein n=1 Tax=Klebsiella quasipneumoniae TaxID=1463165 RepID=UPI0015A78359|nr:hypothetical protein [Klebsiella quasipneumoniae]
MMISYQELVRTFLSIRMAQISAEELKKYHEHCKERDEIGSEINYVSDKNVDVNEFYNDYMNLYPTSF